MAFKPALTVKNTGRKRVCSVYKCPDNNTVMVHRGRHSSYASLFLCEDCIRELMEGYIDVVGEEKAREVFAHAIARLTEAEHSEEGVIIPEEGVIVPEESVINPEESVINPEEGVIEEKKPGKKGAKKTAKGE